MKKTALFFLIISIIAVCMFAGRSLLLTGSIDISLLTRDKNDEQDCFDASMNIISDSIMAYFDSLFDERGIQDEPFLHILYYIQVFDGLTDTVVQGCVPLNMILQRGTSNVKSNALAISAVMQYAGWDVICFYNDSECYLGLNLSDDWGIRKGNWVEKDGKEYYLKVLDVHTPVGSLLVDDPASRYLTISKKNSRSAPLPPIESLPPFHGESFIKEMDWLYRDSTYTVLATIPDEQVQWTKNLPPSLYGMAFAGMIELQNMGLVEQLKSIVDTMSEFVGVNCLYKFCQSDGIFKYDNKLSIKSVSQQFIEGRNDCDGRSVVLYALLRTVMEYGRDDIVFLSWPNHIALGVKPKNAETFQRLFERGGFSAGDFFVLDGAYVGDTQWGDKITRLADTCEIIR